jgi:hypothetical protein
MAHIGKEKDFLKVFLICAIVLFNLRIENFNFQKKYYTCRLNEFYTELVIKKDFNAGYSYTSAEPKCADSVFRTEITHHYISHKYAGISYNHQVVILQKVLKSNICYHSGVISILQKCNNWHTSSESEPPITV